MNASHSPLLGSLRTASAAQVAAWLALSLACRSMWPEGRDGVFWGGLIMAANLYVMRLVVDMAMRRLKRRSQATPHARAMADVPPAGAGSEDANAEARGPSAALPIILIGGKFVVMLASTAAVVTWVDPSPLGLVAGFSTLLIGIAGAAIHVAVQQKGAPSPWTITPPG